MDAFDEVVDDLVDLQPRDEILSLHIEDLTNKLRPIGSYLPEQEQWVDAITTKKFVLAVKPRQLGFTTITLAYLFLKALWSTYGRKILSMVHEEAALDRLNTMTKVFHDNLPPEIQPGYTRSSLNTTQFRLQDADGKEVPGPMMVRMLAGGRGQGRSWTYNDIHATEMSKWPQGTSAMRTADGRSADEEAFSSAMATVHDEGGSCIVESTGNGPRGLFYELYQQATTDPMWAFVFQKWTDVARYSLELTDAEAKTLEADLDTEEKRLRGTFGLTLEQLAWRRMKMRTLRMTGLTFRREFPLTDMEPFTLDQHGWFDQEALLAILQFIGPTSLGASAESLRVFHRYDPRRQYAIGMDTSGGVGRDEAVIHVIRDDLLHVCTWASNRASPPEQALMLSRVSNMYGRPPAIVEANNHGQNVIERAGHLGVNLWKDENGEFFWSTGGRAGNSKRMAMVHIREVVDNEWTVINDAQTVRQAQKIVEKPGGQIEAQAGHDDRIYAYALALWAGRRFWLRQESGTLDSERDRVRRIRALGTPNGRGGWT